jgi:hypothetical protein
LHRSLNPRRSPKGWADGPPDFVGIGTQRAGTTWWYQAITRHPAVVPRQPKELHFFNKIYKRDGGDELLESYAERFARPKGKIVGEWTPGYILLPWLPEVLARVAPRTKILCLVRDPVERYRSGLTFYRNWDGLEAPKDHHRTLSFDYGRYGSAIENVLRHFPRDQVLVLQFERCVREPRDELRRTFDFLSIDPEVVPSDLEQPRNSTRGAKVELTADERDLVERYESEVMHLKELVPEIDLSLWPNFSHLSR